MEHKGISARGFRAAAHCLCGTVDGVARWLIGERMQSDGSAVMRAGVAGRRYGTRYRSVLDEAVDKGRDIIMTDLAVMIHVGPVNVATGEFGLVYGGI